MKKIFILSAFIAISFVCFSCSSHDSEKTETDLKARIQLLQKAEHGSGAQNLAKILNEELIENKNSYDLTSDEIKSLQYLYAYMPINDMAENSFEYFVDAVKIAYKTKSLPWGKTVTDDLFKYFVLPPRVNNETLDNARKLFYDELYPRIKDINMYDAVIEINHWCREKIVYQPTDGRTTPPAQTVARAYGRCGEESTVTVAALRSVGIPAKQVYVPRWAHTNSNHAWVEVWVDGKWYYLGACEPEPYLDRGWFTASASRAMLVNTYAYGPLNPNTPAINGEVISQNALFTEISSTANYAPVKKAIVKVFDEENAPIENAVVSFGIINGNSISSMAERWTDKHGIAALTTGLGTFIVEVFYTNPQGKEYYTAKLLSVPEVDELVINLTKDERQGGENDQIAIANFRVTPPAETRFPKALTEQMQKAHDGKCALDDSIRLAYTSGFRFNTLDKAAEFSKEMVKKGLPQEMESKLELLLLQTLSGGNEVEKFLNSVDGENLKTAVELLEVIRVKDIQEIKAETYSDYLNGVIRLGDVYKNEPEYKQSVLNPRFSNELPIAYKDKLWNLLVVNGMKQPGINDETLEAITKVLAKITLVNADSLNPRSFYMTPASIADFGMADRNNYGVYARALFNVAGIPARMNNLTQELQILDNNEWKNFDLIISQPEEKVTGTDNSVLNINDPEGKAAGRRYLLQKWQKGAYRAIGGFSMGALAQGTESSTVSTIKVEPGYYRILSSIRAADGSMLATTMTFTVKPNSTKDITVQWYPIEQDELVVIGNMDAEWKYTGKKAETYEPTSIINTVGRNFFVLAFLEPTKEPSQHFIRELSGIKSAIQIPIVIMFNDKDKTDFFFKQNYQLSDKINYGYDSENIILNGLQKSLNTTDLQARLPVIIIADSFGNIYYKSIGYNIGVPETITKLKLPLHK